MAVKLPKRLMHRNLLAELLFFKFGNNFASHDYLCQNFPFAVKTPLFFLFIYLFFVLSKLTEFYTFGKQYYSTKQLFSSSQREFIC